MPFSRKRGDGVQLSIGPVAVTDNGAPGLQGSGERVPAAVLLTWRMLELMRLVPEEIGHHGGFVHVQRQRLSTGLSSV
ncbi:hypothetical protein ACFU8Q_08670 [Streptomyces sp. NPDC057543]|uniref:hypothetical protein n=1 Tax=Streptomyces sp. NPDC057543 TaxID=3346163 RepID=UPI0036B6BAAC